MKDKLVKLFLIVMLATLLAACASQNPMEDVPLQETGRVYGFWNGLWDGWTAGFAFIGNLFGGEFGIYQVHNNGNWYDFGFLLGIGGFTGGSHLTYSRKRS